MPHLRLRGVKAEIVQKLSEAMHLELAAAINTPADNFTFEWVPTQFFTNGSPSGEYPFVEFLWFDRGADAKKRVAAKLTEAIRKLNGPGDVAVVFQALQPADYFENGEHF